MPAPLSSRGLAEGDRLKVPDAEAAGTADGGRLTRRGEAEVDEPHHELEVGREERCPPPRVSAGAAGPGAPPGGSPHETRAAAPSSAMDKGEVALHVYDLREMTGKLGIPIYHLGVEVSGKEYYFSTGGIARCSPGGHESHVHRRRLPLGHTCLEARDMVELLRELRTKWPTSTYNLLDRNCQTFAVAFVERLGVEGVVPPEYCRFASGCGLPKWVTRALPGAGGALGSLASLDSESAVSLNSLEKPRAAHGLCSSIHVVEPGTTDDYVERL